MKGSYNLKLSRAPHKILNFYCKKSQKKTCETLYVSKYMERMPRIMDDLSRKLMLALCETNSVSVDQYWPQGFRHNLQPTVCKVNRCDGVSCVLQTMYRVLILKFQSQVLWSILGLIYPRESTGRVNESHTLTGLMRCFFTWELGSSALNKASFWMK